MAADPNTSPKSMIYDLVRDPARDAIQQRVDTEVNNVTSGIVDKNGDGKQDENATWWEQIKAFFTMLIFNIAKMFGAENWLASAFGMPIPETKEVDALSHQVAASVDHSLSKEKFEYKNRDEFKTELHNRLLGDLHADRAKYPSFSDAHLAETAKQTVDNIMARPEFASAFNADGTRNGDVKGPLTQIVAANTFYAEFDKELKAKPKLAEQLKQLSGNGAFGQHEIATVSNALAPALVDMETHKPSKDEAGLKAVADKFRAALAANHEIKWASAGARNLFADNLAATYMQSQHGLATPATFQKHMDDQQKALASVIAHPLIKTQVSEGIRSEVVIGTMNSYDKSGYFSGNNTLGYTSEVIADIAAIKKFHKPHKEWGYELRTDLNEADKAELSRLQNKIYNFAAKDGTLSYNNAPTIEQRERMSDVVSQRVIKVLSESTETDREKLSYIMEAEIKKALQENHASINPGPKDQAGHTIDAVNKNLGYKIYDKVGSDFSRAMRENNGAWEDIKKLRENLQGAPAKTDGKTASLDPMHKAVDQFHAGYTPPSVASTEPVVPVVPREAGRGGPSLNA